MVDMREQRKVGPQDRLVTALGPILALIAWSGPDGPMLASGGQDGMIRRWNATTGEPVGDPMAGHTGLVQTLTSWTGPDGPMLASGGQDGMIRRWNATTGEPVGDPMAGHTGLVQTLTSWTGPDGPMLASGGQDGMIRRWNATTGEPVGDPMKGRDRYDSVRALTSWTGPDGPMLASGSWVGVIQRWNATTGDQVGDPVKVRPLYGSVLALTAWTGPDGPMLASGGHFGIQRWDAATGTRTGDNMYGHGGSVNALTAWSAQDGPMLASGGRYGIQCWNAANGVRVGDTLSGHTGQVNALAAWSDTVRPMLASASDDATIRRWDVITGSPAGEPMSGHTRPVIALVSWISPDGYAMAASTSEDGMIRRWNATAGTPIGTPLFGGSSMLTAWTGPDGRTILAAARPEEPIHTSATSEGPVICWDATVGTLTGTPPIRRDGRLRSFLARFSFIDESSFARGFLFRPPRYPKARILAGWTGPDGHPIVAFADDWETIWRWDAATGALVGEPMTTDTGSVQALIAWTGPDGPMLAAGGRFGIQCWNIATGGEIADITYGGTESVRALTAWNGPDGPMLASGGEDGTIRRWNASTGAKVGGPIHGHTKWVLALTAWTGPDGPMLASGGQDGTIRRWNATTGARVGEPMTGHIGPVRALTSWIGPDGPVLASAGADGTLQVWDANTGELLHRVLVEPISLRGLADRPASRDLLGRSALTQVLANLLLWRPSAAGGETGPSVVTFEGPWGSGKTTVMRLVEARIAADPVITRTGRDLSVAAARKILRNPGPTDNSAATRPLEDYRGALTAWFNPWVSQSSEQVWAGLARSITDAARPVLYPAEAKDIGSTYWLTRNAQRIDRFAASRSLLIRAISPLLGFSAVTALAWLLINLAKLNSNTLFHVAHLRVTPSGLALAIAALLLLVGISHTIIRYYGPASSLLPADLISGPILSRSLSEDTAENKIDLSGHAYWAKSGYLHVVQEDSATTIRDLRKAGYDLVVFIDDLDRCTARTTAEVFEAINLFLSGTTELTAKFVIGLDPAVVAAHLDIVNKDLHDAHLVQYGDDPSPGWAFLRKVVQLPIGAPHVTDSAIDEFLGATLDVPTKTVGMTTDSAGASVGMETRKLVNRPSRRTSAGTGQLPVASKTVGEYQARMGPLERQPEIVTLIRQRLTAQPERSTREAKRLLNVWQLYQRILDLEVPLSDEEGVIERACHLVILAEIVTRWPAIQRRLHQSLNGRRNLQILAAACDDNTKWTEALKDTGLNAVEYSRSVENLRDLLRSYEATKIADLAARVL